MEEINVFFSYRGTDIFYLINRMNIFMMLSIECVKEFYIKNFINHMSKLNFPISLLHISSPFSNRLFMIYIIL